MQASGVDFGIQYFIMFKSASCMLSSFRACIGQFIVRFQNDQRILLDKVNLRVNI